MAASNLDRLGIGLTASPRRHVFNHVLILVHHAFRSQWSHIWVKYQAWYIKLFILVFFFFFNESYFNVSFCTKVATINQPVKGFITCDKHFVFFFREPQVHPEV